MSPPESSPSELTPAPTHPGWRRDGPRFVLGTWVLAVAALIVASAGAAILVSIVATVRAALGGERSSEALRTLAEEALRSPAMAWSTVIASQLALLGCAWLACRLLGIPARERLGLAPTRLTTSEGAVLLVATVVPFALGLAAAWLVQRTLGTSSDDPLGLQRMWSEGSRGASVAWILVIGLLPGFAEEVFYRGFLQRGLLLRFGPMASVLTSGLLFAASHGELAWATAIFPLGVWLGVVAWRTGSVRMTFLQHAILNGLWTAGMMILRRDPTSESALNGLAVALLVLGVLAFPWALAILRRQQGLAPGAVEAHPFLPRIAGPTVVAGALLFWLVPPGVAPLAAGSAAPTLAELEASATTHLACTSTGDGGAIEFSLTPGLGARVALPANGAGVDQVIVALDVSERVVWLAYAGERSGKGHTGRPLGIVEQLGAGHSTTLCLTLTPGPPPVLVRLTVEEEEARRIAAFERATAEGWALRGR